MRAPTIFQVLNRVALKNRLAIKSATYTPQPKTIILF